MSNNTGLKSTDIEMERDVESPNKNKDFFITPEKFRENEDNLNLKGCLKNKTAKFSVEVEENKDKTENTPNPKAQTDEEFVGNNMLPSLSTRFKVKPNDVIEKINIQNKLKSADTSQDQKKKRTGNVKEPTTPADIVNNKTQRERTGWNRFWLCCW